MRTHLPEVIRLRDSRGERPENAVGIGGFWYEPEAWSLPLSPAAKVLYTGLCSFLGPGEINRQDLRNTLKDCTDGEIAAAFDDLISHNLLDPVPQSASGKILMGYAVRPVKEFDG